MNYNDDDIIRIKSGNTSVNMQLVHHIFFVEPCVSKIPMKGGWLSKNVAQ